MCSSCSCNAAFVWVSVRVRVTVRVDIRVRVRVDIRVTVRVDIRVRVTVRVDIRVRVTVRVDIRVRVSNSIQSLPLHQSTANLTASHVTALQALQHYKPSSITHVTASLYTIKNNHKITVKIPSKYITR